MQFSGTDFGPHNRLAAHKRRLCFRPFHMSPSCDQSDNATQAQRPQVDSGSRALWFWPLIPCVKGDEAHEKHFLHHTAYPVTRPIVCASHFERRIARTSCWPPYHAVSCYQGPAQMLHIQHSLRLTGERAFPILPLRGHGVSYPVLSYSPHSPMHSTDTALQLCARGGLDGAFQRASHTARRILDTGCWTPGGCNETQLGG